ncbi:MAG: hypothetical protein OEZ39_16905 [Gammaproteobacteria bacterium]|nr:hypothetical protein [Gammaproteobacteria bacterium]MDH5653541.1 hypothetical protein [Gammaproteobacteria bacterium]
MKTLPTHSYSRIFNQLVLILSIGVALVGCTGNIKMESMSKIGEDVRSGRLVSGTAAMPQDPLNEYTHDLTTPAGAELGLHIIPEQAGYLNTGQESHLLVGISTPRPTARATRFHVLLFDESPSDKARSANLKTMLTQLQTAVGQLPKGSGLTIDSAFGAKGLGHRAKPLLAHEQTGNMEKFLRRYVFAIPEGDNHHFILLLGSHKSLNHAEKQNIIDIINILNSVGLTTSVISYAENPDFAFMTALADKGQGSLQMHTPEFDAGKWLVAENERISAPVIKDLRLTLKTHNDIRLTGILGNRQITHQPKSISVHIPTLRHGQDMVMLPRFALPAFEDERKIKAFSLTAVYYSPVSKTYQTRHFSYQLDITTNINKTLQPKAVPVLRALAILDTFNSLVDAEQLVHGRRPYEAVAVLTRQMRSLRQFAARKNDPALTRDIGVLEQYAKRLLTFNDEWFQWSTINRDLGWDRKRFSAVYQ